MIQTPNRGPLEWTTSRPSAGIRSGSSENSLPHQVLTRFHRAASPFASTTTPRASSPDAPISASMTPGFRILSTLPYASMSTGWLGGLGHATPFSSIRYGITLLSVSPSTSSFLGCFLSGNSSNLYVSLGSGDDRLVAEPDCFSPIPIDPLNRGVPQLGPRDSRQALVAVTTMRCGEHLNRQSSRPFTDHAPHAFHHGVVKAGVDFVNEQHPAAGVRNRERQSQASATCRRPCFLLVRGPQSRGA